MSKKKVTKKKALSEVKDSSEERKPDRWPFKSTACCETSSFCCDARVKSLDVSIDFSHEHCKIMGYLMNQLALLQMKKVLKEYPDATWGDMCVSTRSCNEDFAMLAEACGYATFFYRIHNSGMVTHSTCMGYDHRELFEGSKKANSIKFINHLLDIDEDEEEETISKEVQEEIDESKEVVKKARTKEEFEKANDYVKMRKEAFGDFNEEDGEYYRERFYAFDGKKELIHDLSTFLFDCGINYGSKEHADGFGLVKKYFPEIYIEVVEAKARGDHDT